MVLDRHAGKSRHAVVGDLPALLPARSLLVFNNTRVRKSRLYGTSQTNGAVIEFLLLNEINRNSTGAEWLALCKSMAKRKLGMYYSFPCGLTGMIAGKSAGGVLLHFNVPPDDAYLDAYGHVPLPPYIRRSDENEDASRYQTVYARETGSAAAPTAGLHFTREILDALERQNIETAFLTLHVGRGTFLPVRAKRLEDHIMHTETFFIDQKTATQIKTAKHEGRPVIAVGTTSARALESAWQGESLTGEAAAGWNETRIFIYGDYRFKVVDGLFTNFHTPFSTLLMLVSCFAGQFSTPEAGRRLILDAYAQAVERQYHFFSYGDAMLIL